MRFQSLEAAGRRPEMLSRGLFPVEVDPNGLLPALRELASTTEAFHKIRAQVVGDLADSIRDSGVATQLNRIAQEAVTNAVKHARAETIVLEVGAGSAMIRLRIVDDGVGIGREIRKGGVHANGANAKGPFVRCYCDRAALAAADGELSMPGESLRDRFNQAIGGSLFIEDVAALTAPAQQELLALLTCERARSSASGTVGAIPRIIAGASRHLDDDRDARTFSEMLFYRLNIIHIDFMNQSHGQASP